jgi:hypothetical protein
MPYNVAGGRQYGKREMEDMPTIRIDDEVWQELKRRAEPLVDSANDVLRREFGLGPKDAPRNFTNVTAPKRSQGTRRYGKFPRDDFIEPILISLDRLGGRGRTYEVLEGVYQLVRRQLSDEDLVQHQSGEASWRNSARWARETMTKYTVPPLLNPSSPRGWWEMTEAGHKYIEQNKE